jgi:hypothetical protein
LLGLVQREAHDPVDPPSTSMSASVIPRPRIPMSNRFGFFPCRSRPMS